MTQFAADDFAYIAARQRQLTVDDMDAANESAGPLTCFMCSHEWLGTENPGICPACNAKDPTIPF